MLPEQLDEFIPPRFDTTSPPSKETEIKSVIDLIEFNRKKNPHHLFCTQAEGNHDDLADVSLLQITFQLLFEMVLACQRWIEENVDQAKQPFLDRSGNMMKAPPVSLLLENDVGVLIHLFALMGLGVPVLLLSTELNINSMHSLLSQSGSHAIIVSPRFAKTITSMEELFRSKETSPVIHICSSYRNFIRPTSGISKEFFLINHYISDDDRNMLILHSSGSTGVLKAIAHGHRYLLSFAPYRSFEVNETWSIKDQQALGFSTLPLSHYYGLLLPMASLSIGKPFAIPPAGFLPCAVSTILFTSAVNARSLFIAPSLLHDIAELPNSEGTSALRSLDYVVCGGGLLDEAVGKILAASGVKLIRGFGATEIGNLGVLRSPISPSDWRYFRLREDGNPRVTEVSPKSHPEERVQYRISVKPPGWDEYHILSDIFVTSEMYPRQDFRPIGRADDVIVQNTTAKVQPHSLEAALAARKDVRGALVFGEAKSKLGVLIEPAHPVPEEKLNEFKEQIWSTIVEDEEELKTQARILCREAIVVLDSGQTLPRSIKGSILRRAAYEKFRHQIEHAYTSRESSGTITLGGIIEAVHHNLGPAKMNEDDLIESYVENQILEYIRCTVEKEGFVPSKNQDLFQFGLNSQQAFQLHHFVVALINDIPALKAKHLELPKSIVYSCPTVHKIAAYLRKSTETREAQASRTLKSLMDQYIIQGRCENAPVDPGAIVLLTGGTGALGCHISSQLALESGVSRVICLNRRTDHRDDNAYARQFASMQAKGAYIPSRIIDKIQVLECKMTLPFLGLSPLTYWGLASTVTHIIHNGWPVDFRPRVESFEDHFAIMSNLLELARKCVSPPKFLLMSSIAVVAHCKIPTPSDSVSGPAPEQVFQEDWEVPTMGYARAKLICEKMLEHSIREQNLDGVIVRCGQLSGSQSNGYWSRTEYLPTMLKASCRAGALPIVEGDFSWLPLEPAAATIVDLLLVQSCWERDHLIVYHVGNPVRQSWRSVLRIYQRVLSLPLVPYVEWMNRVADFEDSIQLTEFFQRDFLNTPDHLDTTCAAKASRNLRHVGAVSGSTLQRYAKYFLQEVAVSPGGVDLVSQH